MENINDRDNLRRFGHEFQSKCIASLISNQLFVERILDILTPDYFENDANRWIVQQVMDYFLKYKSCPTLQVFIIKTNEIKSDILNAAVVEQLKNVYTNHIQSPDLKFISEQFLEFCKNQKMKNAIISSTDFLKLGEYDQIRRVVDDALKAGMERNLGHEYLIDIEKRMSEMCRDTVKTNWEVIDQLLDGGLARGELGFVVAPAGSGKSWLLTRLGAEAMRAGKNVVHITLELNENYVGLRYDSCFTGINFQDIRKNIEVVKKKIEEVPGKLFIKYFPIKTIASHTIKMHVERIQMLTNTKIDLIVVDYADLLRPATADKNANSYSEAGSVYEELRAVAGELQVPVWSASQSHRGAHEEDIIQAQNVADSYRKIMTGDFVISLSRKMEDKQVSTARIHVIKNRFGADGMTFPAYFDAGNGSIKVLDPGTAEGRGCLEKMKDGEDKLQDLVRDNWNQIKRNRNRNVDDD
jgi:archaellum biogenesis ATPase FlaH